MVQCAYCGKRVPATEARSYAEFGKHSELLYFCSIRCSLAKLFGITDPKQEFMLGIENSR